LSDFTIPGDRTIRFSVVDALAGKFLIVGGDPLNVQTTGGTANVQIEGDSPGESGLVASATSHQPDRSYGPITLPVYVWANEAAFTTYKTDHGKDHWELMTPDGQGEEQE
jgi:hypothetical protein